MLEAWLILSPFTIHSRGSASSSQQKALYQGKPGALLRLSLEAQREDDYRGKPTQTRAGCLAVWNLAALKRRCSLVFLVLDGELSVFKRKEGMQENRVGEEWMKEKTCKYKQETHVGFSNQKCKHWDSNSFWFSWMNAHNILNCYDGNQLSFIPPWVLQFPTARLAGNFKNKNNPGH